MKRICIFVKHLWEKGWKVCNLKIFLKNWVNSDLGKSIEGKHLLWFFNTLSLIHLLLIHKCHSYIWIWYTVISKKIELLHAVVFFRYLFTFASVFVPLFSSEFFNSHGGNSIVTSELKNQKNACPNGIIFRGTNTLKVLKHKS